MDGFASLMALSLTGPPVRPLLADPDDDMVVEAALHGAADAIVTFEVRTFAKVTGMGFAIVTPAQAYAKLP